MNTQEIKDACKRVETMVDERMVDDDDDAFSWEDAIKELGISQADGLIVLAVMNAAHCRGGQIDEFFRDGDALIFFLLNFPKPISAKGGGVLNPQSQRAGARKPRQPFFLGRPLGSTPYPIFQISVA
jgi:hypothetical protein